MRRSTTGHGGWIILAAVLFGTSVGAPLLGADGFKIPGFGTKKGRSSTSKTRARRRVGDEAPSSNWKLPELKMPTFRLPTWDLNASKRSPVSSASRRKRSKSSPSTFSQVQQGTKEVFTKASSMIPSFGASNGSKQRNSPGTRSRRGSKEKSSWLRWPWSKGSSDTSKKSPQSVKDFLLLPRVGNSKRPR